jgi:hypothetical protein
LIGRRNVFAGAVVFHIEFTSRDIVSVTSISLCVYGDHLENLGIVGMIILEWILGA